MTFAAPWGLLALLAIPAIVAIHLFRRRSPVRRIAGLFLWQDPRQTAVEGRRLQRLPVTVSLVLECLAALALALIVAGARVSSARVAPHLVVLLDDSASMRATNAAGESARDRAVRRVLAEVDRLGADGRVTFVLSGDRPSVLVGPAAYRVEARTALDKWRPEAPDHPLGPGVRLAREFAGREGRLVVVTDLPAGPRDAGDDNEVQWISTGEPLANVGIIAADRSLSADQRRGAVSLTIGNYSDSTVRRTVNVIADGKAVVSQDFDAPPGSFALSIPLPAGLPPVTVQLSEDALARDNTVVLAEPRPRVVGVQNTLPDGRGRDALEKALDAVSGATRSATPHLAFVDARDLDRPPSPGMWRVGFGRAPDTWLVPGDASDFAGPFVLEKRHPILLGVTLQGVIWTGAAPLAAGGIHPVASAGDRTLIGAAGSLHASTEPALLFNLDLGRTNLIRAPDWPILISNLIEMRRAGLPGPERWNYKVGDWVRVRLGRVPKAALRVQCGAVERTLSSDRDLQFVAPTPGGLLQIFEGTDLLFQLGVNFLDEAESDLRRRAPMNGGDVQPNPGVRDSGPETNPLFWILLTLAAGAIASNWCVLAPRRKHA